MGELDKVDVTLLELLQEDATLSVGRLSERIGTSKSACWRRIQKLESKGFISERVTLLNQDLLNLPVTVYISLRTNQHNEKWSEEFKKVVLSIPEILEVNRMSGDLDYLIKAVVPDTNGYDKLYKKLIQANLFDVSSSFVLENMKHTTKIPLNHIQANLE